MSEIKRRPITSRYASLPLISLILKLTGFLTIGFGVAIFLFGVYAMISRGTVEPLGAFILQLFCSAVAAVLLIAVSELIHVFLDIEENTRRIADAATGTITGTTPRITPVASDE